jgi:hypothetical protein
VDLTVFSHLFSRSWRTAYHPKTYPEAGLANLAVTRLPSSKRDGRPGVELARGLGDLA